MGRITSGVGLISGINSRDIIDQLITLESQPKTRLEDRIEETNKVKLAYTDLSTRLTSLKISGTTLKKASTFQAASTTSGDDDILTATASNGAAIGNYQFQVARLVTTQQSVSGGFRDVDTTKVGPGTITIEQGGGELTSDPMLSQLNGGAGVRRGLFRITDRSGKSAVIDVTSAVTINDVLKKINTALDVSVRAAATGDEITLTDISGATTSNFSIQDLGDGHAAADLGIVSDVAASTITGTDVNSLGPQTLLENINDGRGVRRTAVGVDFQVTIGSNTVDVTLGPDVKSIGDVVNAINAQGGVHLTAKIVPGANGIRLTDKLTGSRTITVTEVNGSKAASDLGILTAPTGVTGGTADGKAIIAGLNTVLLSSLKGGAGLALGNISISDRAGASQTINLSTAGSVQDVLDAISNASGVAVTARLKKSGNGIEIVDDSGGAGNLVISDAGGASPTSATDLGIAGTFAITVTAVQGTNLQRQWITENSLLSSYNGGKGIARGKFKITNAAGATATIDLSGGTETRLVDVIKKINANGISVTASINANGDGLLLTDASAGAGKMKVEEIDSTTAKDLNILGTADATPTIDGTFERTITLTADDTLTTLQQKINNAGAGVSAAIINDGSGAAPYRLSVTSRNAGRNGRIVLDSGTLTPLQTTNLVEAQDAVVFLGNGEAPEPLLVTAGSNQITGVIKGVTIDLHGVSSKPVSLGITRTADGVVEEIKKFTDNFNELVDKIKEYTKFDTETNERGLLLGDTTVQTIEQNIYEVFSSAVSSAGTVRVAADVGLKIVDGAKLEFDETKFLDAYATDPEAVETLFSRLPASLTTETPLSQLNNGRGVRTAAVGADFQVTVKDGTTVQVTLGSDVASLGEVLNKINTAGAGKLTASVAANGLSIQVKDNTTTGTDTFRVSALNGSSALADLGLPAAGVDGVLVGLTILPPSPIRRLNEGAGLGHLLENSLSRLIDPVDGTITKENKQLDTKNDQFQSRIDALDKLIASKRERLERQFAQMESVLANLQGQQQALGSLQSLPTLQSR
jgi:flagellar hook-associated protein 2